MLKKHFYTILIGVCAVFVACIFIFSKKEKEENLKLINRTGPIALGGEWLDTKKVIEGLIAEIELNPKNFMAKLNLAKGFIQEGRITGNHAYYDAEAIKLLDEVVANDPKNFDALCCKSTVLMSQHHFSESLKVSKIALPLNPNNAFIYGLLCDAYVELGNYKAAVKMSDKMISIRPDIRSYSRISYLREIHGDLKGAIFAAKLAVSSGFPGLEETAWSRMILANLYEATGSLDSAEFQYRKALIERPNYPFAVAGLGKIEKFKGNYKKAIYYTKKAEASIEEYTFTEDLTELYRLNKDSENAQKSALKVVKNLSPLSGDESESNHGHYADKELAYAYLKINNKEKALKHALLEYKRRPNNIDACEALAWVYYKMQNYKSADYYISKALKTNCKNPSLLCRVALIKLKSSKKQVGMKFMKAALENRPFILDYSLRNEVKKMM